MWLASKGPEVLSRAILCAHLFALLVDPHCSLAQVPDQTIEQMASTAPIPAVADFKPLIRAAVTEADEPPANGVVNNSLEPDPPEVGAPAHNQTGEQRRRIACGTMATNHSKILFTNPHHPEPTFSRVICETVIEKADPEVKMLSLQFERLELYRPNSDGRCVHDKFAVFTDLDLAVSPIICGNRTGENVTIPFDSPLQANLIVSITTSDLDHDRLWSVSIDQLK